MFSEGRSHFSFIAVRDNLSAGNMNLGLILTNGIEEKPAIMKLSENQACQIRFLANVHPFFSQTSIQVFVSVISRPFGGYLEVVQ